MRSDAARRRSAIIEEARRLFAAHGADVALDTIAEAAGVGIATLYRNFASRVELADAVALAIIADMEGAARDVLDGAASADAWLGYVNRLVELDLGALEAALGAHVADEMSGPVRDAQSAALASVEKVLGVMAEGGLVRPDLGALELVLAIGLVTRPQPAAIRAAAPGLLPRLVSILVAGMRPQV